MRYLRIWTRKRDWLCDGKDVQRSPQIQSRSSHLGLHQRSQRSHGCGERGRQGDCRCDLVVQDGHRIGVEGKGP